MSSVMSGDLEPSSPFERLSDDPILHIFSYLPGADLLHLSEMDQKFKRIITESTETMSKIRLVLDFNKVLDLEAATKLAQARRFIGLRLKSVSLTDANAIVKFSTLFELLSRSVDDLIVEGKISRELLSSIIASFLPNLKKCKLDEVTIDAEAAPIIEEISSQSSVNHPLESLKLNDTQASKVLQFFADCNQLKKFCYYAQDVDADLFDIKHMNDFLVRQDHLEKLYHSALDHSPGLAWNRLRCFKLKKLKADCSYGDVDELATAEFLKKLPKLTKLEIGIYDSPSRHLMKAICQIPKLKWLTVRSWKDEDDDEDADGDEDEDEDDEFLERLVNHTVKHLTLRYHSGHKAKLLKFFEVFESAGFCGIYEDLNDEEDNHSFNIKFSPRIIPTNVKKFQSYVTIMAKSISNNTTDIPLIGVEIGHANWRNNGAFRLSNSFCQGLVNQLHELRKLEIYNIADRKRFIAFLHKNEDRLSLEDVKIHEPFGVGEPKPKKLKIQID